MIYINLLPEKYRRLEKTPLPRFIAVLAGVFLVGVMGTFIAHMYMTLNETKGKKQGLETSVIALESKAKIFDGKLEELQEYSDRRGTIVELDNKRVLWSRKFEALTRLLDESPDVWLVEYIYDAPPAQMGSRRRTANTPDPLGILEIEGRAISSDPGRVLGVFIKSIEGAIEKDREKIEKLKNPSDASLYAWADFSKPTNLSYEVKELKSSARSSSSDEEDIPEDTPKEGLSFNFKLPFFVKKEKSLMPSFVTKTATGQGTRH